MRILLFVLTFVASTAASPAPLRLIVTPRVGTAPQTISLRLSVSPDERNRVVCVGYDGPQSRNSCWEVGANAPQVTELRFRGLGEGRYVAAAEVRQDGGRVVSVTQEFCVLGNVVTSEECFGG